MKNKFYNHIVQLQENLCREFEKIDGKGKFFEDKWVREGGGGGITKIIEDGEIIEKGGVNISKVFGLRVVILKKYECRPNLLLSNMKEGFVSRTPSSSLIAGFGYIVASPFINGSSHSSSLQRVNDLKSTH